MSRFNDGFTGIDFAEVENDGPYTGKRRNGRRRVVTVNNKDSKTVQGDVNQAEIKNILANYEVTGIVQHMRNVDLAYRDVSEFTDMSDALQQIKEAEGKFMELPSKLREVFDHDVAKWLDAAHDPEKIEALRPQLEKLGVLDPIEVTPAAEAPVTPAPEAPAASAE